MRTLVVGGGPGGLYAARLIKRARPQDDVLVVEQNARDATYGFGVTLGGPARERMRRVDQEVHDRLAAAMVFNNEQLIRLDQDDVLLEYATSGGAIARLDLLRILQVTCEEVGVRLEHDRRVEHAEDLAGFDLVIAADGVNSWIRGLYETEFGTHSYHLGNRFAWYGVGRAMKPNALVFRHARGGCFVAHYYAYTDRMSTFVAECDAATWENCGLSGMSDGERRKLVESIFARELEGDGLIENKSTWRCFNAVTNERWTHGRIAVLGDALRSAHFSIGSGTRLAMDDASALYEAVVECGDDVPRLLARYVEVRKPIRDQFGEAAERSFRWYERLPEVMTGSVADFTYEFLTRTGRVDDRRLQVYVPGFYRDYFGLRAGGMEAGS